MNEFNVYEKDDEYQAVRSSGFFCWQALLISFIKIPFSAAIYPFIKGDKILALIAFILELIALLLIIFAGASAKSYVIIIFTFTIFGISIGYHAINRIIASKFYGVYVGSYYAQSAEQAINEALKANK